MAGHQLIHIHLVITLSVGYPLLLFVILVPYTFTPLTSWTDTLLQFSVVAGVMVLLLEGHNRQVFVSDLGVASVSWTGGYSYVEWDDVVSARFFDTYGGFFILRHTNGWVYLPVQIERSLDVIDLLEKKLPPEALKTARRGIDGCRRVLDH